ncbi:PAS domain-containing protein, partial [Imhoffiella purpurea]|uniref:PAS domain-containing protein n=1 Tax=Imhoffiella purpurea TaxID=1249627 RepID=UPI0005C2083A
MRTNLPVTQIEHVMEDDQLIVSRTDLKGRITQINLDFIKISGFTEAELIGAPHNLVRHPDMPSAAFEDLWQTVKSGRPWTGMVKNRCKNGDYYWVEANVSPLREQGQIVGYISVRRKPTRGQIAEAESVYARLRAGKPIKPLHARLLSRINDLYITRALPGGLVLISLLFILALAMSLLSLQRTTDRTAHMTEKTLVLDQAFNDMYANGLQMVAAMRYVLLEPEVVQARENLESSDAEFRVALLKAQALSKDDSKALDALEAISQGFEQNRAIRDRILEALAAGDLVEAKRIYNVESNPAWGSYKILITDSARRVKGMFEEERKSMETAAHAARLQVLLFSALAVLCAAVLGTWLVRKIARPLKQTSSHLEALAEGNYSTSIVAPNRDELGNMLMSLKSVQARLDFDMQETKRIALENMTIRTGLDSVSLPVTLSNELNQLFYLNRAAEALWRDMTPEIQRRSPSFNLERMIGSALADYFEDQEVAAAYREKLTSTRDFDMQFCGRSLRLTASPVSDDMGIYRGRVTQWEDRTAEVTAEREIAGLVEGAAVGDFASRLDLSGKEGFFRQLSEGLNRLLDIMSAGLSDVAGVLDAIARGDLTRG